MNKLIQLIQSTHDKKELKKLFEVLLTPKEIQNIEERIQILELLSKGKTQREIAKELSISITTVTRGNKMLPKYKALISQTDNNSK